MTDTQTLTGAMHVSALKPDVVQVGVVSDMTLGYDPAAEWADWNRPRTSPNLVMGWSASYSEVGPSGLAHYKGPPPGVFVVSAEAGQPCLTVNPMPPVARPDPAGGPPRMVDGGASYTTFASYYERESNADAENHIREDRMSDALASYYERESNVDAENPIREERMSDALTLPDAWEDQSMADRLFPPGSRLSFLPGLYAEPAPRTYAAAVNLVFAYLDEATLAFIRDPQTTPDDVHRSLGLAIRNAWTVWDPETLLHRDMIATFSLSHPDDISALILANVWALVREVPFDVRDEAFKHRLFWEQRGEDPAALVGPPASVPRWRRWLAKHWFWPVAALVGGVGVLACVSTFITAAMGR